MIPERLRRASVGGTHYPNRSGHAGGDLPVGMGESMPKVVEVSMASWRVGLTVKEPLQARHRHPPSGSDLKCRGKTARTTEAVEGVGVHSNTVSGFRDGDQIGRGRLVVMAG